MGADRSGTVSYRCVARKLNTYRAERKSCLRMFGGSLSFALFGFLFSAHVAADISAEPPGKAKRFAEGRILVKPRTGLPEKALEKVLKRHNARSVGRLRKLDVRIVKVPPQAEEAVARALSRHRHIEFAEPDMLVGPEQIPDDPKYPSAWHLPKIQAPDAWDISMGDGVTVAVIDTGVDALHPDLAPNLLSGWNVVSQNTDTSDVRGTNGHGTMVAGVAAAASNNAIGVASLAWHARILPVRITNRSDGWAYWSDVANGVTWATDHGAKVANVSYQGVQASGSVTNAAQYMRNAGGMVVAGAGNDGKDSGHGPNPSVIFVSATSSSDTKPSWSSYGEYVDVAAPGAGIWTTKKGGGYGAASGTSFASPNAAGVVALMMSANSALSPGQVEGALKNTAVDLGAAGNDPYYGFGRVNAGAAVQAAVQSPPQDTASPTASITWPKGGSTVQGIVTVDVDAADNVGVGRVELYAQGALVGTDTTMPYSFAWDSTQVANGNAFLEAMAYDAADNKGSDGVDVVVSNSGGADDTLPPTVFITSPRDGTTVRRTVHLAAYATDDVGVVEVNIFVDGALQCAGTASASCGWNTRKESDGAHTVSATARDAAGNSETATTTVTVSNSRGKHGKK